MSTDLVALNSRVITYLARHDGRDKLCRATAYGSDFLVYLLKCSGNEVLMKWIKQIMKMKSGVGVARKCFRVGAPLKDVDALAKMKDQGYLKALRILMHVGNACYYAMDTVELATIFEILPYKTPEIKVIRYRIFVFKTIFNLYLIIKGIHDAIQAIKKCKKAMKEESSEEAKKQLADAHEAKRKLTVTLCQVLADLPIACFVVTDWGKRNIGTGGAGLSGLIGASIAIREIWRNVKAK